MNKTKKIIGAIVISFILLILTKNVYAFSDSVWYQYDKGSNNIDYGATGYTKNSTSSAKQIIWCRSKGGKLTSSDGLVEFNATGTEKNLNRLLACWLYLVGGENGKSPKSGFTSNDIQKILWHQDRNKFSDDYQIQNFAANISTPPGLSNELRDKYKEAVKLINSTNSTDTEKEKKYSKFKITNKNGLCKLDENNDDTAHPKFTSVPGQTVAGEPTGCYYLKQVKLEFNYDAKGDGTYSVVTGIHLIDADGYEVTGGENLSFRYKNVVYNNPTKDEYGKINTTNGVTDNIRVYIPTNLIEAGKKYYVYFEQEWQIKGSNNEKEVYTGTYRLYARKSRQRLISYNVKKETKNNDDISGENDAWIAIKVPNTEKEGQLTYAKYLYGVYATDNSSLAKASSSEAVMGSYKLVGHCSEPEFDDEGTCTNANELATPYYTDGPYSGQEVSFNISEIQNNEVVLVYKFRWYNYSDTEVNFSGAGYGVVQDSFGGSALNLAYINKTNPFIVQGTCEKNSTGDFIWDNPQSPTLTITEPTETIWRDIDAKKYISGSENTNENWPVSYKDNLPYSGENTVQITTNRTANPIVSPGTTMDIFSFVFYYNPINNYGQCAAANSSGNSVYIPPTMNISGEIFLDGYNTDGNKTTGNVDGIKNNGEQLLNEPVKVELYQYSYTTEQQKSMVYEEMINQLKEAYPDKEIINYVLNDEIYVKLTGENYPAYENTGYPYYLVQMNKLKNDTITKEKFNRLSSYILNNLEETKNNAGVTEVKFLNETLGSNFDINGFKTRLQKLRNNTITNEELEKFNEEFNLIYNIQKTKDTKEYKNKINELTIDEELKLIELIEQYNNANKLITPEKNYKNQDIEFTEDDVNELIGILQKFLKIGLTQEEKNSIFNKDNFVEYKIVTNGQYEFNNYPVYNCEAFGDTNLYWLVHGEKFYYAVKFIYNGEKYESTLYMKQGGINSRATEDLYINKGRSTFNQTLENSNYKFNYNSVTANEIAKNRLNEEFDRGSSNEELLSNELLIDASTDPWENPISSGNSTNVNLGLIRRNFDLNLTTSLASMNVSINGETQTFNGYGSAKTISANISSSDLTDDKLNQKLAVQKSDYDAEDIDKQLEVWVNYKVKVSNESVAYHGNSKVNVYCDNRFTAYKVENSNEIQLNKNSGNNEPIVVDLSQVTLDDVESSKEINISMKLDRNTIKDIMEKNSTDFVRTLEFIAQIENYTSYYNDNAYGKGYAKGTIAGKLDEDSIPGNLDINTYNKFTTSKDRTDYIHKEDDADRALGVQLIKQEESRKITGIVFEDATSQHDEDLRGAKAQNNAKLRYGDGKYVEEGTTPKDKTIKGVKVKLIDGTSGKIYEGTSDENGTYILENIIPSANYIIEFTYGDGETKQYNYQDYKSTIDTSDINYKDSSSKGTDSKGNVIVAKGSENYWYSKAGNNSVAKDKVKKYDWSQSMTYAEAVKLENYNDNSKDLSNTATTEKFMVPITEYGKDSSGNAAFTINNMNFGLAEKPRSELTINKVVDHITITTSDGRTLIDGTKGAINSTSWTDRYVQAIVDENLIYGSTLKITYKYYVTNTGEIDFAYIGGNNFYDYGKIGQEGGMIVKTKADKIIDYVDNNLMYDENMQANPEDTNKTNKNYWNTAGAEDLDLLGKDAKKGAKNINTKIVTTELNEDLVPGKSTGPIYLTLSKVLSSSEDKEKNALTYNNYAEIIQATNQLGRRSYHTTTTPNNSEKDNYTTKEVRDDNGRITGFQITNTGNDKNILLSDVVNRGAPVTDEKMKQSGNQLVLSIPGDLDMSKLSAGETTLYWEPDSDIDLAGGNVQIVPPFGSQRVIWTIIATVSSIILAVGIVIIQKKTLK